MVYVEGFVWQTFPGAQDVIVTLTVRSQSERVYAWLTADISTGSRNIKLPLAVHRCKRGLGFARQSVQVAFVRTLPEKRQEYSQLNPVLSRLPVDEGNTLEGKFWAGS